MKTLKNLNDAWEQHALKFKKGVDKYFYNLQFDYEDKKEESDIVIALVFGNFIQDKLWINSSSDWNVCNEFLSQFVNGNADNKLLVVMAMIGSMPDAVLQRILWEYNIDFNTPEAFLRRITPEQVQSISDNYNDLMSGNIPRAYNSKKGFLSKQIKHENLWTDRDWREWKSKGSWAYNLGKLDWGFNLYPKGANNDTQAPRINPFSAVAKFVSIKGDKEQFVVNDVDGKYSKLYKSARSNYILFPNKDVTIGKHICPGFWYTFMIHFIFWIVSPILALLSGTLFYSSMTLWSVIPCLIIGAITPSWIILAVLKFFGIQIGKALERALLKTPEPIQGVFQHILQGIIDLSGLTEEYMKSKLNDFANWVSKHDDTLKIVFKTFFWLIVAVPGVAGYIFLAKWTIIAFGNLLVDAFIVNTGVYLYVGRKIWSKKSKHCFDEFSDFPMWMQVWLSFSVAIIWLHFMTIYSSGVFAIVTNNLATEIFCIMAITLAGSVIFLPKFIPELKEEQYIKIEKFIYKGTIFVYVLTVVLMTIQTVRMFDGTILWNILLKDLAVTFCLVVLTSLVGFNIVKWVFDPRFAKAKTIVGTNEVSWAFSVSHNKWLMSLSKSEAHREMERINNVVIEVFNGGDKWFTIDNILQHVTAQSLEEIESRTYFWSARLEDVADRDVILDAFNLISKDGLNSESAYLIVKKKYDKKQRRIKTLKTFFKVVLFPIWFVVIALDWFLTRIKRGKELYQLYVFFSNKICPHVEERIRIRF